MYLIVGLGNPESDYSKTRHNMGFDVINELSKEYDIKTDRTKFDGIYGTGTIEGEKVILLKPQTYMNLSGICVASFKNFFKLDDSQIIVISDDIELDPGEIRIRRRGSAGTHNGLKSVVNELNTEEFPRIRIGVGKPEDSIDLVEYVIGYIEDEEYEKLKKGIELGKEAIKTLITDGIEEAMNKYN